MKKVGLFYGGRSYEHEISVLTAVQAGTFFPREYELIPIFMKEGKFFLKDDFRKFSSYLAKTNDKEITLQNGGIRLKKKFIELECAVVACHGGEGEDGTLSALLEFYNIPFTSADHFSSSICMDKALTKAILKEKGFSVTPEWDGEFPAIVKPCVLGSSIGISICQNKDELFEAEENAKMFGNYIIEPFLQESIELNCAAVRSNGNIIISQIERPFYKGQFLDFDNKYKSGEREIPAQIDVELSKEIAETTEAIYKALSLFGVVRVDYLFHNGKLFVNEINTIPGSFAYYLFSDIGINFEKLLRIMIEEGKSRGTLKRPIFDTEILKEYANGFKGSKGK